MNLNEHELIQKAIQQHIEENIEYFQDICGIKRRREGWTLVKDWTETKWGKLLYNPNTRDINTKEGKEFRKRFRVPFPVFFDVIVPECARKNIFGDSSKSRIPIGIKCMVALRILARGLYCDDVSEMSDVPTSTANVIFKKFVEGFATLIYPHFVQIPKDEDLAQVMNVYDKLGLAGFVGSMDCTRLKWNRCPSNLTVSCTGKEGYPTLSFLVVVDHSRRVLYCSQYFFGRCNDITVSYNDPYCIKVREGVYRDTSYLLINADGSVCQASGGWLLVDGGFLKEACFIDQMNERLTIDAVLWSEWMESCRKDVECLFGILKARFRFLARGVDYKDPLIIEYAMKTACALNNMIMIYQGVDISQWENISWEGLDPKVYETNNNINNKQKIYNELQQTPEGQINAFDEYEINCNNEYLASLVEEQHNIQAARAKENISAVTNAPEAYNPPYKKKYQIHQYAELREDLLIHFQQAYRRCLIAWPRRFQKWMRDEYPIHPAQQRCMLKYFTSLYHKLSHCRSKINNQEVTIGDGLFSRLHYIQGDTIAVFNGTIMNKEDNDKEEYNGRGGYSIELKKDTILNCYQQCKENKCLASYANSPQNCIHFQTKQPLTANAKLVISKGTALLKAICNIPPDTEILYRYGKSYPLLRPT